MRKINFIAVHCTATSQTATIESIKNYWKSVLGWKSPGYHFIVKPDGEVVELLPIEQVSNGVSGFNSQTINVCYIGGVTGRSNTPIDNRTETQKVSLLKKITELKVMFPKAIVQGHYQFPAVKKACPCFDAKKEYSNI